MNQHHDTPARRPSARGRGGRPPGVAVTALAALVLGLLATAFSARALAAVELPAGLELRHQPQPGELAGPPLPPASVFGVQLVLDDDGVEGTVGVADASGALQFLWFNRFAQPPGPGFVLEEVWVLFPAGAGVGVGDAIELAVFLDPDGDPATGADLLATFDDTVQAVDGATFSVYPLAAPVTVDEPGDVLIGVVPRFIQTGDPPTSPAAIDQTASQGRSWLAVWTGAPPDPPALPPDSLLALVDDLGPGLGGNWMIRGFGTELQVLEVPALGGPGLVGLAALLLLAGLVVLIRRRRPAGAAALALLVALLVPATAGAQVVIDDFSTPQAALTVTVPPDAPGDSAGSVVAAGLGGERDLAVTLSGFVPPTAAGSASAEVTAAGLVFTLGADVRGFAVASWDGADGDPGTLDPVGISPAADLTDGGTQGALRVTVDSATAGAQLVVVLHTDATHASTASRVLPAIAAPTDVFIDFAELVPVPGAVGPADPAAVGAVELELRGLAAAVTVSGVATAPPLIAAAQADFTAGGAPIGGGAVVPGDTFRYRVTIENPGGGAEAVDLSNAIDPDLAVIGAVRTTPVVRNDQYSGFGNVTLVVDGIARPALTDNDSDPDGDPVEVVPAAALATQQGGSVDVAADGTFAYTPPAGFTGVDSFTYAVVPVAGDPTADAAGSPVGPFTGTVNVSLDRTVWFVDNTHGGPFEGTQTNPFAELKDAETASGPGDVIRLRRGDGTTTGYDLGLVMKAGQALIGGGVDLVIDGQTIEPADPGGRPQVTHGAGGHALELASEHLIHGVDFVDSDLAGIRGVDVGHLEVREASITGAGAEALDLDGGDLDVELDTVSSDGSPLTGLRLENVTGSLTVSGATTITDYGSGGIEVTDSPGVSVDFGTTTVSASSPLVPPADGVPIASIAVALDNAPGATFTFDTLDVTASENGLAIANAGTVNVNSTAATVSAAGGFGLIIVDTAGQTNGLSGWTFASLTSADSPSNGVLLDGLTDDLLVTTSTSVTDPDLVGIEVRNSPGRSIDFGATSVTDLNVGAGATGSGIEMTSNVAGATITFDSLTVVSDGGFGLRADTAGTINVGGGSNSIAATGGAALDVTDTAVGAGNWTFASVSSSGSPGSGVNLAGVAGGSITANGGAIAGAAGTAFNVSGGTPTVTYHGTVTQNNAARVVNVESTLGGAVSFPTGKVSGGASSLGVRIDDADGNTSFADLDLGTSGSPMTSTGLTLSGGSAGTHAFADTQIFTSGATGIAAAAGGVVEVTGSGNRVTTTTGIAVSLIGGTTIGANGVTFERVDASNAVRGIHLSGTGTTGSFSVTGDGSTAGSGGTIQDSGSTMINGVHLENAHNVFLAFMNWTNANRVDGGGAGVCDGNTNAGCNGALNMNVASNVSLDNIQLNGAAEMGINGQNVTNFDLSNSMIQNAGDAINEHGIHIRELKGTLAGGNFSTITNTTITNSNNHNVFIVNSTAPLVAGSGPDLLVVSGSTISNLAAPNGANGLLHESRSAADMRLEVSGSTFSDNRGIGINHQSAQGGQNQLSVTSSTFFSSTVTAGASEPFQDVGVSVGATQTGAVTFDVTGNTQFRSRNSHHVNVTAFDTASITGTVANNTNMNGSANGSGVRAAFNGGSTGVLSISGNVMGGFEFGRGIDLQSREGSGSLDVTLSNNNINSTFGSGTFANHGVFIASGNQTSGETNRVCVHYENNTSAGGTGRSGYRVEQFSGTTFQIQDLTPASGASSAQIVTHIQSENTAGSASVTPADAIAGTVVNYTASNCATP